MKSYNNIKYGFTARMDKILCSNRKFSTTQQMNPANDVEKTT